MSTMEGQWKVLEHEQLIATAVAFDDGSSTRYLRILYPFGYAWYQPHETGFNCLSNEEGEKLEAAWIKSLP